MVSKNRFQYFFLSMMNLKLINCIKVNSKKFARIYIASVVELSSGSNYK